MRHYQTRGITLIETVLYISLLSVLLALILPLFLDLRMWQAKQENVADIIREYQFVQAKIQHLVQSSGTRVVFPSVGQHGPRLVVESENDGVITFQMGEHESNAASMLTMDFQNREHLLGNPYLLVASTSIVDRINFFHSGPENSADGIETVEFSISINGFDFGTSTAIISDE